MKKKSVTISIGMLIVYVVASAGIIILAAYLIGRYFKEAELKYVTQHYEYDAASLNEVVGMADYVFSARVIMRNKTEYSSSLDNRVGGVNEGGFPRTIYTVIVDKNLKGVLPIGEEIRIYKDGGVTRNGNTLLLVEGDTLPEAGKTYIFSAIAQPNGELLVAGLNSNNEYKYSKYLEYVDAVLRSREIERVRHTSRYDDGE